MIHKIAVALVIVAGKSLVLIQIHTCHPGKYPTDGHHLGDEVPLGQGKVNYPAFVAKLKEIGYQGDITIEREISGEEQKKDIRMAKELLDKLIAE